MATSRLDPSYVEWKDQQSRAPHISYPSIQERFWSGCIIASDQRQCRCITSRKAHCSRRNCTGAVSSSISSWWCQGSGEGNHCPRKQGFADDYDPYEQYFRSCREAATEKWLPWSAMAATSGIHSLSQILLGCAHRQSGCGWFVTIPYDPSGQEYSP
jgi:hypothetical protein